MKYLICAIFCIDNYKEGDFCERYLSSLLSFWMGLTLSYFVNYTWAKLTQDLLIVAGLGRSKDVGMDIVIELGRPDLSIYPAIYYTWAKLSQDLLIVTGLGRSKDGGIDIVIELGRPERPGNPKS